MTKLRPIFLILLSCLFGAMVQHYVVETRSGQLLSHVSTSNLPSSKMIPLMENRIKDPVEQQPSSVTTSISTNRQYSGERIGETFASDDFVDSQVESLNELVVIDSALIPRLRRYYKEDGERMNAIEKAARENDLSALNAASQWKFTETLEQILGTEKYLSFIELEKKERENKKNSAFLTEALRLQRNVGLPAESEITVIRALKEGQYEYYGRGYTVREGATDKERHEVRSKKIMEILEPYLSNDQLRNDLTLYLATNEKNFLISLPMVNKLTD